MSSLRPLAGLYPTEDGQLEAAKAQIDWLCCARGYAGDPDCAHLRTGAVAQTRSAHRDHAQGATANPATKRSSGAFCRC